MLCWIKAAAYVAGIIGGVIGALVAIGVSSWAIGHYIYGLDEEDAVGSGFFTLAISAAFIALTVAEHSQICHH